MVSTRSHSVLSADGANGDAAATAGEVNSAAPTPRRSGRLRGAPTPTAATAAAKAPPASARAARSRRPLKAIDEEQEQADEQQAAQQQEEQQQQEKEGAGERAAPTARRRSGAAAAAGAAAAPAQQEQQQQAAAEAEPDQQPAGEEAAGDATATAQAGPLKAAAAVVDLLAEQMFAALDGAFGAGAGGSSSSESDSEPEPEPAAGRQQQEQQPAAAAGQGSSDEGSESEGDEQEGHHVPAHLRWRPELTLPGMGPQQQRQRGGSAQAGAAAAAAAAAPGVHVVRRGGKDSLHVPPPDEQVRARAARKTAPDTAGKGWFDLPATKITDEVKLDLRMLRLRGALDPKAHYKKLDDTKFPKYFQMGTVVEGAADFYSGRLTNKQRKRTLTEEIMADDGLTQVRKKRFNKLQEERSYWAKKKPGRKTENERRKKAHHRPKH